MELPRAFSIQPSVWLSRGVQGLYGLTLLMAVLLPVNVLLNVLLTVLVALLWWFGQRLRAKLGRIVSVRLMSPLEWQLSYADGRSAIAKVVHCQVWEGLIVLRFKLELGGTESLLLTQRCVDPQVHRRLRAWLRLVRPASRSSGR